MLKLDLGAAWSALKLTLLAAFLKAEKWSEEIYQAECTHHCCDPHSVAHTVSQQIPINFRDVVEVSRHIPHTSPKKTLSHPVSRGNFLAKTDRATRLVAKCSATRHSVAAPPPGARQGLGGPVHLRHPSQASGMGCDRALLGGCSCDAPATHWKLQNALHEGVAATLTPIALALH